MTARRGGTSFELIHAMFPDRGRSIVAMNAETSGVVDELRALADPARLPGMARVGINVERAIGVSMPNVRKLGRRLHPEHRLALDLWGTGIHEARILASVVDDPGEVTREQMETWAVDFDSWDLCDQVIGNLFDRTSFASLAARAWAERDEEFVKRAGFTLIATRAVHDRTSPDRTFTAWFPTIRRGAADDRNYVRKAVSWSLRQIGKRNRALNAAAIAEAEALAVSTMPSRRWVGRDALRELRREEIQRRLQTEPG
jgi:3-methyladenine DNA glycosylase AlkD